MGLKFIQFGDLFKKKIQSYKYKIKYENEYLFRMTLLTEYLCSLKNSYVEIPTCNGMVLGGEAFVR